MQSTCSDFKDSSNFDAAKSQTALTALVPATCPPTFPPSTALQDNSSVTELGGTVGELAMEGIPDYLIIIQKDMTINQC
jgi:hypothetical protein